MRRNRKEADPSIAEVEDARERLAGLKSRSFKNFCKKSMTTIITSPLVFLGNRK
jgi:hypothetical protein